MLREVGRQTVSEVLLLLLLLLLLSAQVEESSLLREMVLRQSAEAS